LNPLTKMATNNPASRALVPQESLAPGRTSESDSVPMVPSKTTPQSPAGGGGGPGIDASAAASSVVREFVTAAIGLAIIVVTLYLAVRLYGLSGTAPRWTNNMPDGIAPERYDPFQRGKDVLLLLLSLAGAIVGYYTGRVIADRTIDQANQTARTASDAAQQANAAAGTAQTQTAQAQLDKEQLRAEALQATDLALGALGPGRTSDDVPMHGVAPEGVRSGPDPTVQELLRLRQSILRR
jgi:hypothetical protein